MPEDAMFKFRRPVYKQLFKSNCMLHGDQKSDVNQTCQQSVFSPIGACIRIWCTVGATERWSQIFVCRLWPFPFPLLVIFSPFPQTESLSQATMYLKDGQGWCGQDWRGLGGRFTDKISAKYPVWIHLSDNTVIFRHFFSLLRFLSVLIFKHKNQTNKSLVIESLIEYYCQLFGNQTFDFVQLAKLYWELAYVQLLNPIKQ